MAIKRTRATDIILIEKTYRISWVRGNKGRENTRNLNSELIITYMQYTDFINRKNSESARPFARMQKRII